MEKLRQPLTHWQPGAKLHCCVDVFRRSIAALDHANGLEHVRDEEAVDDETVQSV